MYSRAEETQWSLKLCKIRDESDEVGYFLLPSRDLVGRQGYDHGGSQGENCVLCRVEIIQRQQDQTLSFLVYCDLLSEFFRLGRNSTIELNRFVCEYGVRPITWVSAVHVSLLAENVVLSSVHLAGLICHVSPLSSSVFCHVDG